MSLFYVPFLCLCRITHNLQNIYILSRSPVVQALWISCNEPMLNASTEQCLTEIQGFLGRKLIVVVVKFKLYLPDYIPVTLKTTQIKKYCFLVVINFQFVTYSLDRIRIINFLGYPLLVTTRGRCRTYIYYKRFEPKHNFFLSACVSHFKSHVEHITYIQNHFKVFMKFVVTP